MSATKRAPTHARGAQQYPHEEQRRRQAASDHCRDEVTIDRRQIVFAIEPPGGDRRAAKPDARADGKESSPSPGSVQFFRRSCKLPSSVGLRCRAPCARCTVPILSSSPWLNMSSLVGACTKTSPATPAHSASSMRPTAPRHVFAPRISKTQAAKHQSKDRGALAGEQQHQLTSAAPHTNQAARRTIADCAGAETESDERRRFRCSVPTLPRCCKSRARVSRRRPEIEL